MGISDVSLESSDRKIVIMSLAMAGLSLFFLLRDDFLIRYMKSRAQGPVIGHVVQTKNDARLRQSQSLTWYGAFANETIAERDSLFTGHDSELMVEISGQRQLSLDPNSLVVVHTRDHEILFDLRLGGIAAAVKPQKSDGPAKQVIKVMTEGKVASIKVDKKSSPVFIKKNPKGTFTVISRSGDVEVKTGNKTIKANPNEAIVVEPARPEVQPAPLPEPQLARVEPKTEAAPAQIEPETAAAPVQTPEPEGPAKPEPLMQGLRPQPLKPSQTIVLKFKEGLGVINPPVLEWKPVENAKDYRLEIATDKSFKNALHFDSLEDAKMTWKTVTPGDYFWRVKAQGFHDDETLESEASRLHVKLPPPELSAPTLKNEVTENPNLLDLPQEVEVQWTPIPMAKGYRFIASVDGKPSDDQVLNSSATTLSVPPNKEVTLKVAAVDEKGRPISAYSKSLIGFKRNLQIKAPKAQLPNDGTVLVTFDKKRISPLLFTWETVKEASGYEIQFASDPEFKNLDKQEKVKSQQYLLKERFTHSDMFWRVRAHVQGHASEWSQPRLFKIQSAGN